jgi:hypothetical protein
MKDLSETSYFAPAERLVDVLMRKTQNNNPLFFRILVAYYFAKIASMMRCNIQTMDRGLIPVNMYALNLASSGHGKGHSTNIIEEEVIHRFRRRFLDETFLAVSEINLARVAITRAQKYSEDPDETLIKVTKEFEGLGTLAFSFDSGTSPAVKQMRHLLLMSGAGSVNFEMDEIGSNLMANTEVLSVFLELYDVGKVKPKLIKNTAENRRSEDIEGRTPTNMMLYGTPSKLLNGSKVEEEFYQMLETGYARRCLFGYTRSSARDMNMTSEEVYALLTDPNSSDCLEILSRQLEELAAVENFAPILSMSKEVSLELISYKIECDKYSDSLRDHEEVLKAEVAHRYFKALKLAGAYAFIDGASDITQEHLYSAIKLVEDSGIAFTQILTRERNYVKLAKYIANAGREVTQVDLVEDLAFYKGSTSQMKDMMALAIAYGYKNNIIIKRTYDEGIEFLQGESMDVTDLDKMVLSYSNDITEGYQPEMAPFDKLHKVVTADGYHYTAHQFAGGHRNSVNLIQGFNLAIVDIDQGVTLETAKFLLKDYKCMFATTKRHTPQANRFRILFPLSHIVKLDPVAYSEFMTNIFNWLPFTVDTATKDCARKWESFKGEHYYQDGIVLDAMLFIPSTKKAEDQAQKFIDNESLGNLERWFFLNTSSGNRSNQLIKYALVLVDSGYTIDGVRHAIMAFNKKLQNGLSEDEINTTIMQSVIRAITKRDIT